jgi:N-methylhydantoinase A
MAESAHYRLGCDIGGTFTDFVLLDTRTGRFEVHKVLTTPRDPSEAVEAGVLALGQRVPGCLQGTEHVIHGTTLVINAIIERTGARTAVLATKGFPDVLEMRREIRYDIYDLHAGFPAPLVLRPWRREVTERVTSDGGVLIPLDAAEVREALRALAAEGVESVAVCLLHSYANAAHEREVARIAAEEQPQLAVSLSSEVLPEIKEYERTSTTVVNAYAKPLTERYLQRLEERLRERGLAGGLFLMLSGGGIMPSATARRFPVRLIESGPVGGVLAAVHLARQGGIEDLVVFDMGGTTAKACFVHDGELPISTEYEVDRVHRFKRGSGTPVGVPTVDLIEIGAGGGSLAAIDRLGLLQVGPRSAGADPGPICYGRGGSQPTVTDADLALGYLSSEYFLGGSMRLDLDAARAGIERELGRPLSLSAIDAAWGVHEVVNENMAAAIRTYCAEKGGNLSRATLVAFGGAGPVHAFGFAKKLGINRILVPRGAGVFSALGFLVAPVSIETSRTHILRLCEATPEALGRLFGELEQRAAEMIRQAVPGVPVDFARAADMCYAGQGHSIRIPLAADGEGRIRLDEVAGRFLKVYTERYGYTYDDLEIQWVTLRVTASARQELPPVALPFAAAGRNGGAAKGERLAYAPGRRAMIPHRVFELERLSAGTRMEGPLIVEDVSSTLIVGEQAQVEVDRRGWLLVTLD